MKIHKVALERHRTCCQDDWNSDDRTYILLTVENTMNVKGNKHKLARDPVRNIHVSCAWLEESKWTFPLDWQDEIVLWSSRSTDRAPWPRSWLLRSNFDCVFCNNTSSNDKDVHGKGLGTAVGWTCKFKVVHAISCFGWWMQMPGAAVIGLENDARKRHTIDWFWTLSVSTWFLHDSPVLQLTFPMNSLTFSILARKTMTTHQLEKLFHHHMHRDNVGN